MTVQLEQELTEHRKENSDTWLLRYDLGHGKPIFHAKSVKKKDVDQFLSEYSLEEET